MHSANSPLKRCLYNPIVGHRVQSEWDDHGEVYPLSMDDDLMFVSG